MIKIIGNDIMRGGQKIGYFSSNDVYSHEGKKLGYFEGNHIYNREGKKLGYLEGDFIYDMTGTRHWRIEDNHAHVEGGELSDVQRAAVRFLLGD